MIWIFLLWEKSFTHLFRIPHFYSRDLWIELYLFTLSILGVARDQVWYKLPPFSNSNFSIPNELASLFREAQLDDFELHNNGIRILLLQKYPAMLPFGHRNSDAHRDFSKSGTLAASNAGWSQSSWTYRPPSVPLKSAKIMISFWWRQYKPCN